MPRINDLADDFAERFAVEPTRARGIARYLREAGMLSQGARGVNAPHATFLDAARLMTGMMLLWRPANRIALDVKPILDWCTICEGEAKKQLKFTTFEEALSSLFEYQAKHMPPIHPMNSGRAFVLFVKIYPHRFYSEIVIAGWDNDIKEYKEETYRFSDIEMLEWSVDPKNDLPELEIQKWKKGFYLEPTVFDIDLLAISHIVAGQQPLGWSPPQFEPDAPPSPERLLEILAAHDENRQALK